MHSNNTYSFKFPPKRTLSLKLPQRKEKEVLITKTCLVALYSHSEFWNRSFTTVTKMYLLHNDRNRTIMQQLHKVTTRR